MWLPLGLQAAVIAGKLNHPVGDYPMDRRLAGPDLIDFLRGLR